MLLFAGEPVRPNDPIPAPDLESAVLVDGHPTIDLQSLVAMKLNAFRDKDRMHLRDMLDVEIIDETWVGRYPTVLAERLQLLIDNPE